MTKLDMRAITSRSIKTNLYLFLAAMSYPKEGVSYIDRLDLRSKSAIAAYVTDVANYRTVQKSFENLEANGYLEYDSCFDVYELNEKFENRFIEISPQKADELCQTLSNDENSLLLFLYDKCRYFGGKYTTTQGKLAEDAWELTDTSKNRSRIKQALNKLMTDGKLKWKRVKKLSTYRVEISDVHL